MAQISSWTQNLTKGENIWKKEKENHIVPHARTFHSVRGMSFMHTIT